MTKMCRAMEPVTKRGGGDGATTGVGGNGETDMGTSFTGAERDWHQLCSIYHKVSISVCA